MVAEQCVFIKKKKKKTKDKTVEEKEVEEIVSELEVNNDLKREKKKKKKAKESTHNTSDLDHSGNSVENQREDEECVGKKQQKKRKKEKKVDRNNQETTEARLQISLMENDDESVDEPPKKRKKKIEKTDQALTLNEAEVLVEKNDDDCVEKKKKKKKKKDKKEKILEESTSTDDTSRYELVEVEVKSKVCEEAGENSALGEKNDVQVKKKKKKKKKKSDESQDEQVEEAKNHSKSTENKTKVVEVVEKEETKSKKENKKEEMSEKKDNNGKDDKKRKRKKDDDSENKQKLASIEKSKDLNPYYAKQTETFQSPVFESEERHKKFQRLLGGKKHSSSNTNKTLFPPVSVIGSGHKQTEEVKNEGKAESFSPGGQWGGVLFENTERQNKFMRLLGGAKSSTDKQKGLFSSNNSGTKKKGLFGSLSSLAGNQQGVGGNRALGLEAAASLNQNLEDDYNRALNKRLGGLGSAGIGFAKDPAEGKKFHIDKSATKSIKFSDDDE